MNFLKNKYTQLFLCGLISSFAFAPLYLCFIFFFTFYFLLKNTENTNSLKSSFYIGWSFGFGYFMGNCYWYCNSLLIEPLKFAWLLPFAITIIPAYLAIYTGLTILFLQIALQIIKKNTTNKFITTLLFAFFWTIFEYFRSIILTGFPWNLICYSLGFSDILIQTVSIYGCNIFNFILLIIYSCVYVLKDKKYKYYYLIYIFIILFIIIYGFIRLNTKINYRYIYNIRLIQPNINQTEKLQDNDEYILNTLIEASLKNNKNNTYIIWPEAALPYHIFYNKKNKILNTLKEKLGDKVLITGGIRIDENKIYNSVFVIKNGNILNYYDKYHIVPFGEFIPFKKFLPFLENITGTTNISKAQTRRKMIKIDNTFPIFSPNICYESIFTDSINKNSELIINFTNDSWFGNSSGPYQHFTALKFRAVESGIPAIRVANSGISALIDKYGRIIVKTKLNTFDIIDLQIRQ